MFSYKLVGALFIVSSMFLLGQKVAASFGVRVAILRDLVFALQILETEVSFALSPLATAASRIARGARTPATKTFFTQVAFELANTDQPLHQVWFQLTKAVLGFYPLTDGDLEVIGRLGLHLGLTNRQDQVVHITRIRMALEGALQEAQEQSQKYQGLCQKVGLTLGLTFALLCW